MSVLPEGVRTELNLCTRCGACNSVCPEYIAQGRKESAGPRAFLQISKLIGSSELEITIDFIEYIYECSLCGRCDDICPVSIPISELIWLIRGSLIDQGYVPPSEVASMPTRFSEQGLAIGDRELKGAWLPAGHQPAPCDAVFFATCVSSLAPESAAAAYHLLREFLKIETIGRDELCCGALLKLAGYKHLSRDALENLGRQVNSLGAKMLVVGSHFCLEHMRSGMGVQTIHVVNALLEGVDSKSLRFKKSKRLRIGLVGISGADELNEAASSLLSSLDDVEMLEPPILAECGSGSLLSFDAGSKGVREHFSRILTRGKELKLDAVVFVDPSLYVVARQVAKQQGIKIDVSDVPQFLLRFL